MSSLIKCPNCQQWNENLDYCSNCNELLNYGMKKELEDAQKKREAEQRPKDRLQLYMDRLKSSDRALDKVVLFGLQSSWFLLIAFVSMALAILVFGPG
jgi:hypothetical protein